MRPFPTRAGPSQPGEAPGSQREINDANGAGSVIAPVWAMHPPLSPEPESSVNHDPYAAPAVDIAVASTSAVDIDKLEVRALEALFRGHPAVSGKADGPASRACGVYLP